MEYSKKSVTGQISLKDRFNTFLSEAIHDVPVTDRIILDTGDGAAINFLGDVEAALNAALRLRASLLAEDAAIEPALLVRIGINLGPVRLVRDINGQPNIVGDGINVAQRVMGFADASQILVSRSYYDAVSRLSSQYTGMFHSQGSRTDKHVREHEIYAIGYPGDQTTKLVPEDKNAGYAISDRVKAISSRFAASLAALPEKIKQASVVQRLAYAAVPVVALLAGLLALWPRQPVETPVAPVVETMQSAVPPVAAVQPVSAVAAAPTVEKFKLVLSDAAPKSTAQTVDKSKHKTDLPADKKVPVKPLESRKNKVSEPPVAKPAAVDEKPEAEKEAYISVSCKEGSQVFMDGVQKGRTTAEALLFTTRPGKHKIIITHTTYGIYSVDVVLEPGKTRNMKPKECN